MANVFISHSSHDKPFVRKLAAALLSEGFPVWLDSWELQLGDSLIDKIYDGLTESSFVIVVLSENALKSGWVDRELNAALAKEQQIGRTFLIPIKADSCIPPLKIANRIYADFLSEFSRPLTDLVRYLDRNGAKAILPPPEKELVCATFFRGGYIDRAQFERRRKTLSERQSTFAIERTNIVINEEREYEFLKSKLHSRIDNIQTDPYFSPDLHSWLQNLLNNVNALEEALLDGIALMIKHNSSVEAVDWFCRILRGQAIYSLWSAQIPDAPDLSEYGSHWESASLLSDNSASKFFETKEVEPVHIWSDSSSPFSIWLGTEIAKDLRDDEGRYLGPMRVNSSSIWMGTDKYIYPQLLEIVLTNGHGREMIWDMDNVYVGIR
ncbi:toll/interleukin-1 receptor domain-containing protein [Vibrio parahaemolyticus]|nr:toll/interleukin-1 receptor domain-containing protein [Vibrio parahaemolyticus]HCE1980937.1 toll/interleukin-1 receptor domain-containing protein [Vibrio parahaemolyticus]HCG6659680.1 toll/interleukin-1 receptor domain-containing protein [Vibrio parahaemolyticus]